MLIRPATSATLTQCWFIRTHAPARGRRTRQDDYFVAVCRYCRRPIHSRTGDHWTLADGIDLDALAEQAALPFICVSDPADGLVIARIAIDDLAGEKTPQEQLTQVREHYAALMPGRTLDIKLVGQAQNP